jgi:hypothetical protein
MLDMGVAKHLLPVFFPSVSYKEKIFIPWQFKVIDLEYVLQQYATNTINKIREG